MKKAQLKKILKPIVKECIKETFLEQGILSSIIAEVIKGTQPLTANKSYMTEVANIQQKTNKLNEQKRKEQEKALLEEKWTEERERKRKILDATGIKGVNLFEGTEPLARGGDSTSNQTPSSPLANMHPDDPGIDISNIFGSTMKRWDALIK